LRPGFVRPDERAKLLAEIAALHPLWEQRFSTRRGPPPGETQRGLLRPVYWLGNWQFACLGYYEPPNVADRAVEAEPFPPTLAALTRRAEAIARAAVAPADVPAGWTLNTCLVNFYGSRVIAEPGSARTELDVARVGDHRDLEPGPVASISLGERALFQFVRRGRGQQVVKTQWLDDGSLQVFGGWPWKDDYLHRVQRVEDKRSLDLPPQIPGFRTRRINLTLRYVPPEHIVPLARLDPEARLDVLDYVHALGEHRPFWRLAALSSSR
jgi:alkylated DNA repair dioxygenase AlkB